MVIAYKQREDGGLKFPRQKDLKKHNKKKGHPHNQHRTPQT
jgi:hypothetical protein